MDGEARTRPQGQQKLGGSSTREQSQACQEMQWTPAKKRDNYHSCTLVYTPPPTFLPSLVSLALCCPLTTCPHHLHGASPPPQSFSTCCAFYPPTCTFLPISPTLIQTLYLYLYLYLPCTLLALAPLYLLYIVWGHMVDEIANPLFFASHPLP